MAATNAGKEPADQAGYMELDGATKDADCSKVEVEGGVASEKGWCREFEAQPGAQTINCGTCTQVSGGAATDQEGAATKPSGNSQPVVTGQPS
jgi:hypothetical protein